VQDGRVILEPGSAGEFVRRQIQDNLQSITQAARKVLGFDVTAVMKEPEPPQKVSRPELLPDSRGNDLLEKAKREPVVRSFLDVFPGPVKAEKIGS